MMLLAATAIFFAGIVFSQPAKQDIPSAKSEKIIYPAAVSNFYALANNKPFWFTANEYSLLLRQQLIGAIKNADSYGLDKLKYHLQFLTLNTNLADTNGANIILTDRVFTDAAIAFCKDVYEGDITGYLSYDEISAKYYQADMHFLLSGLIKANHPWLLNPFITSLEPQSVGYRLLANELQTAMKYNAARYSRRIAVALNYARWISHFHFDKYILVNIPAATLYYYQHDSILLSMKAVVGKPSTKTPAFAAYCDQVVLYPYWNVPPSIALNELLPKFKRNPGLVDGMNMQVIDANGRVINHHKLNWDKYDRTNFPYSFRQSTGCDNSLGVMKFNLTDPFNIYLHDTNFKLAFLAGSRYYSHGCIRLENPFELGNYLVQNKIDTAFLQLCLRGEKPTVLPVSQPVPVLVIYILTNPTTQGTIENYKDIYRKFK